MKTLFTNCTLPLSGGACFAVENGRFAAPQKCERTYDLGGACVLPAFCDAHSHILAYALSLLQADGTDCVTGEDVLSAAARFAARHKLIKTELVTVKNLRELPPRAALDKTDMPLHAQHASGHAGVFNAAALRLLGLPQKAHTMTEAEYLSAVKKVPMPAFGKISDAFYEAQKTYLAGGFCLAQEGFLSREMFPLYERLLAQQKLHIPVAAYPSPDDYDEARAQFAPCEADGFRISGIKIFLDGSPQLKTAYLRKPYADGGRGAPLMGAQEILEACRFAAARGAQLLAHANGDGAAACFLAAVGRMKSDERRRIRPVLVHAQIIGDRQLSRAARLGVVPSFFPAHVKYWGDTHIKNLGRERAVRISPARSALQRGIPFTLHQDTPVCPPAPFEAAACAVCRKTSSGEDFSCQAIGARSALVALTENAALQYGFSDRGRIAPGYRADFLLLDRDPLACPPEQLSDVRVVATYLQGRRVLL